ncbi:hypothetical protein HZB78_05570 [Candidatus Collierbacteria bacterium]|nr:hypothetical protein [Candidatus Collierbacteria bacterium]
MISARAASLQAQRTRYRGLARTRRVFNPNSLAAAGKTAARRSAGAEMANMVARYGDGLESNESFLAYLTKAQNNPLFSLQKKVQIQNQMRDSQRRVRGEKLEAMYRAAPEQSFQRVQAAAALSGFYQTAAAGMETDTPAQSQMLQQAAQWGAAAQSEQDKILKEGRRGLRVAKFYELAQGEQGTEQALRDKASAYDVLAAAAENDGAATEAVQYQTQAQETLNKIPALLEKLANEKERGLRGGRLDKFRQIQDQYHDGKIDIQTAARLAGGIRDEAVAANDTSLLLSINAFGDKLQSDLDKPKERGDIEGLETIRRKTDGGLTSLREMKKTFTLEDDNFNTAKRQIEAIPDAMVRTIAMTKLYAGYLYGEAPNQNNPDGFEGLQNRGKIYEEYSQSYPNKNYENQVRDIQEKFDKLEITLANTANQLDALGVDEESAKQILGNVMTQLPGDMVGRPEGSQQMGILVSYDQQGRPFEKIVPLNAEYVNPDTGEVTRTRVGWDVGRVQGTDPATGTSMTKYVKLMPVGQDPQFPDFYAAQFNGEWYVTDPTAVDSMARSQLVKAAQAAGTNDTIKQWYDVRKAEERPLTPQAQEAGQPKEQVPLKPISAVEALDQNLITPEQKQAAGVVVKPQEVAVPETNYVSPPEAKPTTVKIEPPKEVNLSSYGKISLGQSILPAGAGRTPTDTRPMNIIEPEKANRIYNAAPAPTPIQQSGLKLDLGPQYAPYVQPPQQNIFQKAAGGISSLFQFLKPKQDQNIVLKPKIRI